MGTCACAFRPFFLRLPTRPTWNNNALSAQPPKKLFSKNILLSGSPTIEFYFPQKGRSVSNSYFSSSKVFYTNTYMVPVLHIHTCIIRAIHSTQLPKFFTKFFFPLGSSTTIFFFSYFYSFRYIIHICIFFPIYFIKICVGQKHKGKGGDTGIIRDPTRRSRAWVRIL